MRGHARFRSAQRPAAATSIRRLKITAAPAPPQHNRCLRRYNATDVLTLTPAEQGPIACNQSLDRSFPTLRSERQAGTDPHHGSAGVEAFTAFVSWAAWASVADCPGVGYSYTIICATGCHSNALRTPPETAGPVWTQTPVFSMSKRPLNTTGASFPSPISQFIIRISRVELDLQGLSFHGACCGRPK